MKRHLSANHAQRQRGVVLVVALLFLLLLTVMAVVASSRALLQERMAGAMRSAQQAQWSAETALRGVEWQLFQNGLSLPCYPGTTSPSAQAFRAATGWFTAGGTVYQSLDYTAMTGNSSLAYNPVYIVEYLGQLQAPDAGTNRSAEVGGRIAPDTTYRLVYRVTARAAGGNPNIVRVLESTVHAQTNQLPSCALI